MQVNNYEVVDRHNRPNVNQRVALRTFFINDGEYVDPYEISSVQIFKKSDTLSPKSVLGTDNLVTSVPLMEFAASSPNGAGNQVHCTQPVEATGTCNGSFDETNYKPGVTASGIYRIRTGEYVAILDQTLNLSGWDWNTNTQLAASNCGAVNDYVDYWSVKLVEASKYQVIKNNFSLYEDTFFGFTQPLLLTTSNKLMNKHVRLGEKIDLKISTETTLQNKDVDESIQNIFKDSVITEATINIAKVNYDPALPGPFSVVTGGSTQITGDNTLLYNWNTATLVGSSTFGSPTGTYSVRVKYNVLNQTIISPLFYLTVS
jgi:hypothetical protein